MKKIIWQPELPPARLYKKENLQEILKTSQFIYQIGESPQLRMKSKEVAMQQIASSEMKAKIKYLKQCFEQFRAITSGKGKGIAAVQVGISERFFLLFYKDSPAPYRIFINPRITKRSNTYYRYPEACMSGNSLIANVVRPAWVEFEYVDEKGKKRYWKKKAATKQDLLENRVVQHEIDHLEGIINIDLVPSRELVFESDTMYFKKAKFEKATKLPAQLGKLRKNR